MQPMTPDQVAAFWVWYKSFNGGKRRSFTRTATALADLGITEKMLRTWHRECEWDRLATEKDAELETRIEREVTAEIVGTYEKALERQRDVVAALYKRFLEAIPKLPVDQIKIADLIKLMEFETNFVYGESRGMPQGNMLAVVLGMMPTEDRAKFHGAIERARDSGRLQFASMGSPGRN